MKKNTHRIITAFLATSVFFMCIQIGLYLEAPLLLIFLGSVAGSVVPISMFISKPMRCDQDNCYGIATLVLPKKELRKWYSVLRSPGHECTRCSHLIKIPRYRRRNNL